MGFSQKGSVQLLGLLVLSCLIVVGILIWGKKISGLFRNDTAFAVSSNVLRGNAGDYWADVIIGKPSFSEINPFTTVGYKLWLPHGVVIDRNNSSDNKMYIDDAGNNRILGFDLNKCLASNSNPLGCTADIVIGQPNLSTSACNGDSGFQDYPTRAAASAYSLCGAYEGQLSVSEGGSGASMAVDSSGALYVFDAFNNRVLKYNSPFTTDSGADDIWGQTDYASNQCNQGKSSPDATTLCYGWGDTNNWTAGVDVDSSGNLWVVDSGNNRVLRFPKGSHTADLVLGQSDFTHRGTGSGLNQFHDPSAVRVDSSGTVYVADQGNNRVLTFSSPFSDGMNGTTFGSGFSGPTGVDFDPTQSGKVWIDDSGNNSLELWNINPQTISRQIGASNNGTLGDATGSLGVDSSGDVFVAIGLPPYDNDVLMFNTSDNSSPTKQVFGTADNNIDSKGTGSVQGLVVKNNQLIEVDGRLLYWNNPESLVSGQAADGYAMSSNFNSTNYGCCQAMTADDVGHLYTSLSVAGDSPNRIQVYSLPLTTGETATTTLLNTSLQVGPNTLPLLGGGSIILNGPYYGLVASDDGNFLWISDQDYNRIVRVRDPLTNPTVDVVLGQTSALGHSCNQGGSATSSTLCTPGSIALDKLGNLYVSDDSLEIQGNMRLLEFNSSLFPTNTGSVVYGPSASKIFPDVATWQPAFDFQNHMVVGYNPYWTDDPSGGWFPGVYLNPLGVSTAPDSILKDYYSMAFTAAFDDDDNLYIGDLDRSRILIYKRPLWPQPTPTLSQAGPLGNSSSDSSSSSCGSSSPTTPDLFQVNTSYNSAEVYFAPSSGIYTGYTISYGYSKDADNFSVYDGVNSSNGVLSYKINYLNPSTIYYFKVKGVNGCASSGWGDSIEGRTGSGKSWGGTYYKNIVTVENNNLQINYHGKSLVSVPVLPRNKQIQNSQTQTQQAPTISSTISPIRGSVNTSGSNSRVEGNPPLNKQVQPGNWFSNFVSAVKGFFRF